MRWNPRKRRIMLFSPLPESGKYLTPQATRSRNEGIALIEMRSKPSLKNANSVLAICLGYSERAKSP